MKSETERVQKARNCYVSSCEAAKRGGEAAEVAPKGRLINVGKNRNRYVSSCEASKRGGEAAEVAPKGRLISVASDAYCCFTTVPSGPHCYMHGKDG